MKTAILVMVRLGSTRLPQKAIKPIMKRPMICHMLDRLKLASRPEQIILCTTTLPEDDALAEIAEQESVCCFRGHPDDVLQRLTTAAQQFSVDTVIVTSGDNPFQDPEYIDRLVDFHQQNGYDYSRSQGLPLGVYAWALSRPAMMHACRIKDTSDTAGWVGYFTETGLFSWGEMPVDSDVHWPDLRLTVDTPEDFELISRIFDELYTPGSVFTLGDIIELCRRKPELIAINAGVEQRPAKPIKISAVVGESGFVPT